MIPTGSSGSPHITSGTRLPFEEARVRLARLRVSGGSDLAPVLAAATELAASTLDVERVSVWMFVHDRLAIRCFDLYERSRGAHSQGSFLLRADYPRYFAALEEHRAIVADDAFTDPATRDFGTTYLEPLGIRSMLDAPIYREGDIVGVVCHEHVGAARAWTTEEIAFAGAVADVVALQLEGAARQEAERALLAHEQYVGEVQRMETLGRLASGVAHDFRNLLAVVLGHAGILEGMSGLPAEARQEVERIRIAAERGLALTRDLGGLGREEDSTLPEVVTVREAVERFLESLRVAVGRHHPIELRVAPQGRDGFVLIRTRRLERALLNLVLHARDVMPDGGPIAITLGERRVAPAHGIPAGDHVTLAVHDRGPALDEATRAALFDPSAAMPAAGRAPHLGLTIAARIVEAAGGFAQVEGSPEGGNTVILHLPRVTAR